MKFHKYLLLCFLCYIICVLYTPEILNTNIEQEVQELTRKYTPQERQFLDYFQSIDKHAIKKILSKYHSTGPFGYSSALILSRILKVKERISSDRELCDKLAKNPIYREAIGIRSDEIPATFCLKNAPAHVPKYLSSNISDGGLVSTASECMIFLRAFFEGQLFDKAYLERMMSWNSIFFPLRYGYGLMNFKLPRFFWPTPLPELIGHSGSTGSFAFLCPSRSLYFAGTVNKLSPAKPFFLMIDLVRAISR